MAFIEVLVLVWILSAVLAYFATEAAAIHCIHCDRQGWDFATREFALVCGIVLGPIYLLIAAELLLFALVGEGLTNDRVRHYKDS